MESGRQYEVWPCPFCKQETTSVIRLPKSVNVKRNRVVSLPGGRGLHMNPDIYVISTGCAKCEKTQEEAEKRLKEEGIL